VIISKESVVCGKTVEPMMRAKLMMGCMEAASMKSAHLMAGHGSRRDRQ
jgi:hypothetical protein